MIYRRKIYKILPEHLDNFNAFCHDYLLPNQIKNKARLVGRWVSEDAMRCREQDRYAPCELFRVRPYDLVTRYEGR
ncbi:MAG TPA: hypothetical protein VFV52_01725 [Bacilli bacterium]|nr:hypothetical protein [Bacilli bacterium]